MSSAADYLNNKAAQVKGPTQPNLEKLKLLFLSCLSCSSHGSSYLWGGWPGLLIAPTSQHNVVPRPCVLCKGGYNAADSTERNLVKVATFNINNINKRLDNLLAWLAKAESDVVSLQELKAEQKPFP
jgi:hypothetical protein